MNTYIHTTPNYINDQNKTTKATDCEQCNTYLLLIFEWL